MRARGSTHAAAAHAFRYRSLVDRRVVRWLGAEVRRDLSP